DMMYVAAIMAFAPTLLLMYAVLMNYTYPKVQQPFFSDPALFGLFAVGLVAGTLLFAAYTWFNWSNMIYMALFAAIECLAIVTVLNLKRFHGKSDTVFYGYGLGLGVGCAFALGTVFYLGTAIVGIDDTGNVDVAGYVWLFVISLSHILMLSSIGTTVGEGIARLRPMEYALQAVIVNVVFAFVLAAAYNATENGIVFYASLLVALVVSAAYFYLTMHVRLSKVIRDVLKMEGKPRKDVPK
ncbi:MAG: hypothetical protein LBS92_01310, partial [Candidatus Methanoplasma sp.]|nr:hypothetical protein [Candidatus Methanoplasma sp.]